MLFLALKSINKLETSYTEHSLCSDASRGQLDMKFCTFYITSYSSPCLQHPATSPCPELKKMQSNPSCAYLCLDIYFWIKYSPPHSVLIFSHSSQ
jgi:hypothetical protein